MLPAPVGAVKGSRVMLHMGYGFKHYSGDVGPCATSERHLAEVKAAVANLTREQVRESFATPETVPFWDLPQYIGLADRAGLAASGYRLQFQKLLFCVWGLCQYCLESFCNFLLLRRIKFGFVFFSNFC